MITEVRAFEGGHCRHLLATLDGRTWRVVKFQAVCLALRHAREGWVLVDTAYGERFHEATRVWPYRLYRWATPVQPAGRTSALLAASGIDPGAVRHVIVTHFHADHIGGLAEFSQARIHFQREAWTTLRDLRPFRQVRAAFLPTLVPADLAARANAIAASSFAMSAGLPFPRHDLFGDGSIQLVDLPGHAPGQVGLEFESARGTELYVADAYWRRCQIERGVNPTALAMMVQWDAAAYRGTVARLRELARRGTHHLTACHDDGVAAELNALGAEKPRTT